MHKHIITAARIYNVGKLMELAMNTSRQATRRAVLSAGLICAILLAGCRPGAMQKQPSKGTSSASRKTTARGADGVSVKADLKKAEMVWVDERGNPIWKAGFAEGHASQMGDNAIADLTDVKAVLYRNGQPAANLTAPVVSANNKSRELTASGGVKIVSLAENGSVTADKLVWKSREDKIYATGGVHMVKGNIRATAVSLVADTALNKVSLTNGEISLR